MIEVEITNYESIAHTKIKIEGFTTLVGRNHLGKSATIRAINAALTNKDGNKFIRWGETFCEVRIKIKDLDILWHKEDKNSFYEINGKKYTKIGRGDPPSEILEAGFKPIVIGDQKINLNYAVQFLPLFLIDKRDSKTADLLTSVYGLDRIYKAIDLCNKEQKANTNLLRIREKDLQLIKNSLTRFNKFPKIIAKIPDIKNQKKKIDQEKQDIVILKLWEEKIEKLFKDNKRLAPVENLELPKNNIVRDNLLEYRKLIKYQKELYILENYIKNKSSIELNILPINSVANIKEMITAYKQIITWVKNYKQINDEINKLEKIKNISLPICNIDLKDIKKIQDMYDRLKNDAREIKEIESTIRALNEKIEEKEIKLKSFDICPLCGAKRG